MNILLDTNVLLDTLLARELFVEDAMRPYASVFSVCPLNSPLAASVSTPTW